jgi:hypothetical protein
MVDDMGPCSLCTHEMLTRGQGLAQTLSDSAGVVVVPAGHMRRFPGTVRVLSSREGTAALLRHKLCSPSRLSIHVGTLAPLLLWVGSVE